ncbi:MAG TPA: LptA/OstA family protein, partial [Thermoanaerobaculia bacterium]|nr:LptA/OstA family protein [Thermoanaerobaculia bacterium]
ELAVLAFGAVFAAVVALSLKRGLRPGVSSAGKKAPELPASTEGGRPTTVLSEFDYTETVRGKPAFRIRADRTIGFGPAAGLAPDRYALEKVSLRLYPENGEPIDVLADRANYDMRTKAAVLTGNVRWSDEKGAMGETETVTFHPEKRLLEAPNKVHFSQGSFDVVAASGRHDVGRRETFLSGPVRGSGTGEGTGGLSSLAADSAAYRRDEQVIDLEGNVSTSARRGDRLHCDRLLLKTGPDGKHLEWARASGSVRGRIVGALAAAAGPTLVPGAPMPLRDYAGDQGVLLFGPDGQARSMSLSGRPATVAEAGRRIAAETIDLDLAAGRPSAARAQGSVRLDAPPNRSESDKASVAYGPDGAISSLELSGNVRMSGDGKSGTAETAIQLPARSVWLLTGNAATSATVVSGGSRVSAPRIEIGEKRRDVTAEGGARAVFAPEKGRPAGATPLGDPDLPTYGKASRIVLDDTSHLATLSGAASLWQGDASLAADDITLNDAERTLVAVGNVRAVMPPPAAAATTTKKADKSAEPSAKAETSVVTARRLVYREAASSATFDGGVVVTRGPWRASASTGTAFLDKERKVERVELVGDVAFRDAVAGRSGQADRAVDYPPEGRTVLEGKPARVNDASGGNRVAGATLTITQRGRRVEVTAPEGGKTETLHKTKRD